MNKYLSIIVAREKVYCNTVNRAYFVLKQARFPLKAGMTEVVKRFITTDYYSIFFSFILIVVSSVSWTKISYANTCKAIDKDTDNEKTTFCFFSLNNPKEKTDFANQYKDAPDVDVKEFYGEEHKGKEPQERFKEMLKSSECDSLVISGHHTGYFIGEQSQKKPLNLDFIEDMSCEPGCADWFSNVDSLFLQGCQTVKTKSRLKTETNTADSESIRIVREKGITNSFAHTMINQAYSSTLATNDKLSDRYLRMFPNSSLYGWGGKAPGEKAQSENSLPQFIDLVSKLHTAGEESDKTTEILNFVNFINQGENTCKRHIARAWAKHWTNAQDALPTACYIGEEDSEDKPTKEDLKKYQSQGCALNRALKDDNDTKISQAISDILNSGEAGIQANFNRLMSLITNQGNKEKPSWYQSVIGSLSRNQELKNAVIAGIESDKTGFTRKSDYLYFYNAMGWKDKDKELSNTFLQSLTKVFNDSKSLNTEVKESMHLSVLYAIEQNELQGFLHQIKPEKFTLLLNNYNSYLSLDAKPPSLSWRIQKSINYINNSKNK